VSGRVINIREQSKNLVFIDLEGDSSKVQLFWNAASFKGDFSALKDSIKRGDILGVVGAPGKTKTGELSVRPTTIE